MRAAPPSASSAASTPVVAGIAAAAGNFLAVLVVVTVTSRARSAVAPWRSAPTTPAEPVSKGRRRFLGWLDRFGVPGASLLGPLAIPTHFTSAMVMAAGTARSRVLFWQGVAIMVWTTLTTTLISLALNAVATS